MSRNSQTVPAGLILLGSIVLIAAALKPQEFFLGNPVLEELAAGRRVLLGENLARQVGWHGSTIFAAADQFFLLKSRPDLHLGVFLLQALLALGSFAGMFLLVSRYVQSSSAALLGAVFYLVLTAVFWQVSSPIWSAVLLPLGLLLAIRQVAGLGKIWNGILLLALSSFWAGCNDNVILLPLSLLTISIGALFSKERESAMQLLICAAVTTLGASISTEGFSVLLKLFYGFASADPFVAALTEWRTPNYHSYPVLAIGVVVTVLAALFSKGKVRGPIVVLGLIALPLSLLSIKFQPMFAIPAGIVVAVALDANSLWPALKNILEYQISLGSGVVAICLVNICLATAGVFFNFARIETRLDSIGKELDGIHSWSQTQAPNPKSGLHLLNELSLAGELAARSIPMFVDERLEHAYLALSDNSITGTLIGDYSELVRLGPRWKEVLERWDFNCALIRSDSSLATILKEREGWVEVAKTPSIPRIINGRPADLGISLLKRQLT